MRLCAMLLQEYILVLVEDYTAKLWQQYGNRPDAVTIIDKELENFIDDLFVHGLGHLASN